MEAAQDSFSARSCKRYVNTVTCNYMKHLKRIKSCANIFIEFLTTFFVWIERRHKPFWLLPKVELCLFDLLVGPQPVFNLSSYMLQQVSSRSRDLSNRSLMCCNFLRTYIFDRKNKQSSQKQCPSIAETSDVFFNAVEKISRWNTEI